MNRVYRNPMQSAEHLDSTQYYCHRSWSLKDSVIDFLQNSRDTVSTVQHKNHRVPSPDMSSESSTFATLLPRSKGGLNGQLTPSRRRQPPLPHGSPDRSNVDGALGSFSDASLKVSSPPTRSRCAITNPIVDWRGLTPSAGAPSSRSGDSATERDGVQAGYSLTAAVAKIDELERAEFDLKLRLYYTEERLEEAAGGASTAYLHQEIANAKRDREVAEDSTRRARETAAALQAKCNALLAQVREMEASRKAEQERRLLSESEEKEQLKTHVRLLEQELEEERKETARLREDGLRSMQRGTLLARMDDEHEGVEMERAFIRGEEVARLLEKLEESANLVAEERRKVLALEEQLAMARRRSAYSTGSAPASESSSGREDLKALVAQEFNRALYGTGSEASVEPSAPSPAVSETVSTAAMSDGSDFKRGS